MTRTFSALFGLLVLALTLPMPFIGCSSEIPEPVQQPAPDAVIETIALSVGGMT